MLAFHLALALSFHIEVDATTSINRAVQDIGRLCYIPEIQTKIILYSGVPNRSCESFSYYDYGPSLCLWNITMPKCSHAHMLLTLVVSSPTPDINYYRFSYYLPNSYHMHFTDYYFAAVKITDTRSSRIPELRHTFKYINCSTSMYFISSNIDLDSLLALVLLVLL
jgi:hypothetical protein